jgi:hypothetical protein
MFSNLVSTVGLVVKVVEVALPPEADESFLMVPDNPSELVFPPAAEWGSNKQLLSFC